MESSSALLPQRLCSIFLAALCASILGCSANVPSTSSYAGGQLHGSIHGGQQPLTGASLQLYAAATTGYGEKATPLLTSAVMSDATGSFSITGDYTCPSATSQLYIVATGGNPGLAPGTDNKASELMAALGPCSLHGNQYTLDPNGFISINEVTTVASVYALAAFIGADATHIGTSSTNAVGLANSFHVVNNLVNTTTGTALTVTPAGNGTAPQAAINTLGNILATCVNSDGTGTPCSALFAAATPNGGTSPTDTIQAIRDIARNPGNNVAALYGMAGATPPFQPTLSPAPSDWLLAVTYSGGALTGPGTGAGSVAEGAISIDAQGNVWIPNAQFGGPYSVTELSPVGAVLSGAGGYTGGGLNVPTGLAIDPSGNVWVAGIGNVVKLSSSGTILSGTHGYTGGGLNIPVAIALDGQGDAWVSDFVSQSVIKLDNSGHILSGAAGFSPGSGITPLGLGVDRSGNVWVGTGRQAVVEFNNGGTVISGSGYTVAGIGPSIVAFDASGNAWTNTTIGFPPSVNLGLNNVAKLSSTGAQLSPPNGYPNCVSPGFIDGGSFIASCLWWSPDAFAVDGAGNVWGEIAVETKENGRFPNPMFSYGISEISNSGTILSGGTGFTAGVLPGGINGGVQGVAIDGGGDVWLLLLGGRAAELVGAATPVVTPFSLGVKNGTLGSRP